MNARVPSPDGTKKKRKRKDAALGRVVGGRYQLLLKLASGGMGSVYAGRAVGAGGFERRLAIKMLHEHLAEREKFVAMFLDEARLAAKIHHPNVVSTLDVFEWDDRYYLVMEYVEGLELGRLLHSALQQRDKLPVRVVMRIVLDALAGLVAAHELTDKTGKPMNLVHRDISPQNILVGADGISRLTDFGVAKAEDRIHVTQGVEFKGKVAYASPEQLEHSVVEQRSDVFAMGIILWETLTQKRLFKAKDKHGVRRMVLAGDYPLPSSVDPTLFPFDSLIEGAMAMELQDRTPTAAELMRQVEEVASTIGGPAGLNDVRNWVRSLSGAHLSERAEDLREAESAIPYPSEVGSLSPSAPATGATPPPAVPEQSEVVVSAAGRGGYEDPGPTQTSRSHGTAPEHTKLAETRLSKTAAAEDAASFDESATRKYERPDSQESGQHPPALVELRTDPSDISVELLESEPGHPQSGVEEAAHHSSAKGHDAPFSSEAVLTTSAIEAIAARHQRTLWIGAALMLLASAAIVGTVIALAVSEEEEPPVMRVIEVETETEPEPETETEAEAPAAAVTPAETAAETEAPPIEPLTEARPAMRRRPFMRRPAMTMATTADPTPPPTMDPDTAMTSPDGMPDNPYRDL